MYQLVNMYQPVFRLQPKVFSAGTLMSIIAMVIVFMLVVYVSARSTTQVLQRTSAEMVLHNAQLDAQLDVFKSNENASSEVALSEDITTLEAQISDRSALLEQIDDLFGDANLGFGNVFELLARTNLPGLWLTGVEIEQNGNIEISGTTVDPKLVPRYLKLITHHPPLANLNRGTVNLTRSESRVHEINFVLSSNSYGEAQ